MIRTLILVVVLVLWNSHLVGQRSATRLGNELVLGPLLAEVDTSDSRPPSIDRCTYPKAGIGYVRGRGLIGYSVDERGRADSLTVLSVEGLSREGLESIAGRVLEGCRFRPASVNGERVRVEVRQWLQFHSPDSLLYGVAEPYTPLDSTMTVDSSAQFAVDDIEVDEKPRFKGCMKDLSTLNAAVFEVSYVVDARGRVSPRTVRLYTATDGARASEAPKLAASCTYTPARSRGRAVSVAVRHVLVKWLVRTPW